MRIVIDTNIWISGLLWKGDAWRLLTMAEAADIEICIAYSMLLELEEVLAYERFHPRLAQLETTPAELTAFAMSISTPFDVMRVGLPIIVADPDDDIFLLCAVEADADCIVSQDRHLRMLKSYQGIRILDLVNFWAMFD